MKIISIVSVLPILFAFSLGERYTEHDDFRLDLILERLEDIQASNRELQVSNRELQAFNKLTLNRIDKLEATNRELEKSNKLLSEQLAFPQDASHRFLTFQPEIKKVIRNEIKRDIQAEFQRTNDANQVPTDVQNEAIAGMETKADEGGENRRLGYVLPSGMWCVAALLNGSADTGTVAMKA